MTSYSIAHLKLFIFTALVSLSFPIGSFVTTQLDPLVVTWVRYLIASLLFVSILVFQGQFAMPRIKDLLRYGLISLPALSYFLAMFIALKDTSALDTSALSTSVPLMSAIMAVMVFKRRTSVVVTAALVAGMIGAGLIIFRGDLSNAASITLTSSNKIYLLGCFAMALNPIVVKALYKGEPLIYMTCWTLICATLILTGVAMQPLLATQWTLVSMDVWSGIVYLAVFATALSFFLFQQGSIALAPEQVSAYTYIVPVFVLFGGQFTRQAVVWSDVMAGVVIVTLAMATMILSSRSTPAKI